MVETRTVEIGIQEALTMDGANVGRRVAQTRASPCSARNTKYRSRQDNVDVHVHSNHLPSLDIPDLAGAIDASGEALAALKVKLAAGDLPAVPRKRVDAPPARHIPQLSRVVE